MANHSALLAIWALTSLARAATQDPEALSGLRFRPLPMEVVPSTPAAVTRHRIADGLRLEILGFNGDEKNPAWEGPIHVLRPGENRSCAIHEALISGVLLRSDDKVLLVEAYTGSKDWLRLFRTTDCRPESARMDANVSVAGYQLALDQDLPYCRLSYLGPQKGTQTLLIPPPCSWTRSTSDGNVRAIQHRERTVLLVESSRPHPVHKNDCDTRLQAVLVGPQGVTTSQSVEKVLACPPAPWDENMFL